MPYNFTIAWIVLVEYKLFCLPYDFVLILPLIPILFQLIEVVIVKLWTIDL